MKAIMTRFAGPISSRGSRFIASDGDGNRVTVSADYALDVHGRHRKAAEALCAKMKWTGADTLIGGGVKGGYVCVFGPPVAAAVPGQFAAALQVACAFLEHPDVVKMPFAMSPAVTAAAIREYLGQAVTRG